jgi:hypothetical protein
MNDDGFVFVDITGRPWRLGSLGTVPTDSVDMMEAHSESCDESAESLWIFYWNDSMMRWVPLRQYQPADAKWIKKSTRMPPEQAALWDMLSERHSQ